MKKLVIMAIAFLFFSCESTSDRKGLPTEPQSGVPQSLAKATIATFEVEFVGDVSNFYEFPHQWPQRVSSGTKRINTPHGEEITLELKQNIFHCFEGPTYTGYLLIGESKKNVRGTAQAWFWFYGEGNEESTGDVYYILQMYGDFIGEWPLDVSDKVQTTEITLDRWVLTTESKRDKKNACTGNGSFSSTVTVTRIP